MNCGDLTERVTIMRAEEARNGFGETEREWREVAAINMSVQSFVGEKKSEVDNIVQCYMLNFICFYHQRSLINETDRLKWGGNTYSITSIYQDRKRRETVVKAEKISE